METKFAPSSRTSKESLVKFLNQINATPYVQKIINALPHIALIVDENRQIVFSNEHLLVALGLQATDLIGQRPGEALHCANAWREPGGCGTSLHCETCGVVSALLLCLSKQEKVSAEARVFTEHNGEQTAYDFKATASPFESSRAAHGCFNTGRHKQR
ncbi:MAG: hypothetical protein HC896_18590, partial [Bacteroidales bacterium]|nr:hypothetical protein [Bacteroidales bacterium]